MCGFTSNKCCICIGIDCAGIIIIGFYDIIAFMITGIILSIQLSNDYSFGIPAISGSYYYTSLFYLFLVRLPRLIAFLRIIYYKRIVKIRTQYFKLRLITLFPSLILAAVDFTLVILSYQYDQLSSSNMNQILYKIGYANFIVLNVILITVLHILDFYFFYVLMHYRNNLLPKKTTESKYNFNSTIELQTLASPEKPKIKLHPKGSQNILGNYIQPDKKNHE